MSFSLHAEGELSGHQERIPGRGRAPASALLIHEGGFHGQLVRVAAQVDVQAGTADAGVRSSAVHADPLEAPEGLEPPRTYRIRKQVACLE